MSHLKLFAFPYAGGSSGVYDSLKPLLLEQIDFIPVELAGRGKRMGEKPYENLDVAIDDLCKIVIPQIGYSQFAFLGHSMGALLSHALAKRLEDESVISPNHIFFSGRGAIQVKRKKDKIYHQMNDKQFKEELHLLGGTPREFFQYPELMELFLPLLRNDFRISETTIKYEDFKKMNFDITVFTGTQDDITEEQINGWNDYTTGSCNIHTFKGGHFFINNEMHSIAQIINDTVAQCIAK
ncbi:thioesterase II family protein [Fulvivirga ligni]|uniref:thioesterase II family protein n=1 Tax=Fulvivirga ligni TaxID=2904246 RepID=UPI001F21F7A8|nr:thioesterase domain-containing protein [Fulvivirga ligni]UII23767.1 thioesterase domain-containing protein [Fulvivirga ligni]